MSIRLKSFEGKLLTQKEVWGIQLARATLQTREYVVETIPATGEKLKSIFARIGVQEVVNKLVHDVEEKFACDKAAKDTLDHIIKQLEVMDPTPSEILWKSGMVQSL